MAPSQCSGASSVLFENDDSSIVVIDIPRTLEDAQALPGSQQPWRLVSGPAPSKPFQTPEPRRKRDGKYAPGAAHAADRPPAAQIADLMTEATVQSALQSVGETYTSPLCLPRKTARAPTLDESAGPGIPPEATPLRGSIDDLRETFMRTAPAFDLVVLDPPWPNRSARRRSEKYSTARDTPEIRNLLTSIPLAHHLSQDGLVAVWITNKASIPDLLAGTEGVFASWGVQLVAEWTWVKITDAGEPLYALDSAWRKPWEKLLIAKRVGRPTPASLSSKVIVAVPDVHSRKPCLRGLFQPILRRDYAGLEVFARNLTAGWWSWGDEAMRFQEAQHWTTDTL